AKTYFALASTSRASARRSLRVSGDQGQTGGVGGGGPAPAASCSAGSVRLAAIRGAKSAGRTPYFSCNCLAGPCPSRECTSSYIQWRKNSSSSRDSFIRGCLLGIDVVVEG